MKKKRGWPKGKKRGTRAVTATVPQNTDEVLQVPKKRGRPPKNKVGAEAQPVKSEDDKQPKRRGRPPGNKSENTATAQKRRGRPPGVKTSGNNTAGIPAGFDILKRGLKMREALQEALSRGEKSARLIVSDPNKPKLLIPILPFQMQMALQAKGLVSGTLMDIYGPESVGKTTFKYTIMGWGMRHNSPIADFGSEAKPMYPDRIMQCLHWDKPVARLMYDSIYRRELHDIVNFVDEAEEWLMKIRDPKSSGTYVPLHIPAIIGIDSWGQLMDEGEAGSFAAYGGPSVMAPKVTNKPTKEKSEKTKARERDKAKKDAAKIKEIGAGGTFGSAKLAAAWCRRLPHLLSTYNAFVINIRPQTDKVDMHARPGGSFIAEEDKAKNNNQSRGGKSFPKLAAYEFILGPGKKIRRVIDGQDVVTGQDIFVNVYKNSFGPRFGNFTYRINIAGFRNSEQFQDFALDFSATLPDVLKSIGLDVVRYSDNDFSCESLGVDRATCAEFEAAFYKRGDVVEELGQRLKIKGYGDEFCMEPKMNKAFMPATEVIAGEAAINSAEAGIASEPAVDTAAPDAVSAVAPEALAEGEPVAPVVVELPGGE
jgi:hypothetical protein